MTGQERGGQWLEGWTATQATQQRPIHRGSISTNALPGSSWKILLWWPICSALVRTPKSWEKTSF